MVSRGVRLRGLRCTVLVLAGCASSPPPRAEVGPMEEPVFGAEAYELPAARTVTRSKDRKTDREGTPEELAALQPLMKRAEELRGRSFLQPVGLRVQDPKTLQVTALAASDRTQSERYIRMLRALGLSDEDAEKARDVKKVDTPLLAYYDFFTKRLVLREDVALGLGSVGDRSARVGWRSTILHELVHALQDQHFDIGKQLERHAGFDERQAFCALMEGDAMFVSMAYEVQAAGVDFDSVLHKTNLLEQFLGAENMPQYGVAMGTTPMLNPLYFRYMGGALFVAALFREGGWSAIDRLYRGGQLSTHEVLSPNAHLGGFAECGARVPEAALRAAGYAPTQVETVGRLLLSDYMASGGPMPDYAASAWRCDQLGIWEKDGKIGAAWVIGFGAPDLAERAAELVRAAMQGIDPPKEGAAPDCITLVHRNKVLLLRHVRPRDQARIQKAFEAGGGA